VRGRRTGPLLACVALLCAWVAGCGGGGEAPRGLPGAYSTDIPALGTYARRVELTLRAQGDGTLTLSTEEGQLHSYRDGRWEFRDGKVVLSLFTKALATQRDAKGPAKASEAPDEVIAFRLQDGALVAVDYDRQRWNGATLTLKRAVVPAP
jgi:hypothetical protein